MKYLENISGLVLIAIIIFIVLLGFFDDEILQESIEHQMLEQVEK